MVEELNGRVALVSGAASGIGRAVAVRLAAAGARVAGLDLVPADGCALPLVADLRSDGNVERAAERVRAELGAPSILVHAAAASVFGGCLDTDPGAFADVYDVNVLGAVRLLRAFAPDMLESGQGAIVFLSSINAAFATPTLAAYAASKAALESLTRTAALEFAPQGVRVNAVAPASVDTPLLRASFDRAGDSDRARADNIARHPLGRLGTAEEVAELVLFLASDRSAWMTGGVHFIDGGAHVTRRG